MTSTGSSNQPSIAVAEQPRQQDGPYVLRSLLEDVPLSADGSDEEVQITSVEYWDSNLYIGTSASELLHFVRIPPDPSDPTGKSVYILASRQVPAYAEPVASRPGVQQILLLPRISKACILCNGTVSFLSLPELSPDLETQVKNCLWIGGVDLNEPLVAAGSDRGVGVAMLLSLRRRIQVAHISDSSARAIKVRESAPMSMLSLY
jgi:hypothetical protein